MAGSSSRIANVDFTRLSAVLTALNYDETRASAAFYALESSKTAASGSRSRSRSLKAEWRTAAEASRWLDSFWSSDSGAGQSEVECERIFREALERIAECSRAIPKSRAGDIHAVDLEDFMEGLRNTGWGRNDSIRMLAYVTDSTVKPEDDSPLREHERIRDFDGREQEEQEEGRRRKEEEKRKTEEDLRKEREQEDAHERQMKWALRAERFRAQSRDLGRER